MVKIDISRRSNKMLLASGDISIEFDVRFGEKMYPFNCAMYNIRLYLLQRLVTNWPRIITSRYRK